jgi:hypothetical protein
MKDWVVFPFSGTTIDGYKGDHQTSFHGSREMRDFLDYAQEFEQSAAI